MNAKTCKNLRKAARQGTIGMPERKYITDRRGSITLDSRCTRAAYKQLKKLVRSTI